MLAMKTFLSDNEKCQATQSYLEWDSIKQPQGCQAVLSKRTQQNCALITCEIFFTIETIRHAITYIHRFKFCSNIG